MRPDGSMACSWCGDDAPADGGYRLVDFAGARELAFCRLEHVIPWIMREGRRQRGEISTLNAAESDEARARLPATCAQCETTLEQSASPILLTKRRAGHDIVDGFCSLEHLRAWASAGGRWAKGPR